MNLKIQRTKDDTEYISETTNEESGNYKDNIIQEETEMSSEDEDAHFA